MYSVYTPNPLDPVTNDDDIMATSYWSLLSWGCLEGLETCVSIAPHRLRVWGREDAKIGTLFRSKITEVLNWLSSTSEICFDILIPLFKNICAELFWKICGIFTLGIYTKISTILIVSFSMWVRELLIAFMLIGLTGAWAFRWVVMDINAT